MGQKVFFVVVIVVVCAVFLKTRAGGQGSPALGGFKEKSMA